MEMSFEAVLKLRKPAFRFPFSVSPDGRLLAFTLAPVGRAEETLSKGVSSEAAGCSLWMYDLNNNTRIEIISDPNRSSWSGVWSPVDNRLAFFCDVDGEAGLWLWAKETGAIRVSKQILRPFFGFESPVWTPDGRYIIVKSMPSEEIDDSAFRLSSKNEYQSEEPIVIYKSGETMENTTDSRPKTWVSRYRAEIVKIDVVTQKSHILARGFHPLGMVISPNGRQLVFANAVGFESPGIQQMTFDLWVTSIEPALGEKPRCIAKSVFLLGPTFTWYDDRTVIYTTAGPLADGGLWAVDIDGKSEPYRIAFSEKVPFHREFDPPLRLMKGGLKNVWFSTNTSSRRVSQFMQNPKASLYFLDAERFTGLLLVGEMEVLQDAETKRRLWKDGWEAYYPLGVTDPDYSVLRFTARWGNYYRGLQSITFEI